MDVRLVSRDPVRVALLRHKGPYEELGPKFESLWNWAESQGLPTSPMIGLYWDNPMQFTLGRLRSAAGVEVPLDFVLSDVAGLLIELDTVVGGPYASVRHVGPYRELARLTTDLLARVEGPMGRLVSDAPVVEIYRNDPEDVSEHQLITDLLLPLR